MVAWRPAVLDRVRAAASDGIRTVVIAPANVYGDGGGLPAMLAYGPTTGDSEPALLVVGGDQHFANVHRADIAALYTLALTEAPAGSYYLGANRDSPTMTQIAKAVSVARGLDGRIAPEPLEQSRQRLGSFTDAVLIDAQIDCQRGQPRLATQRTVAARRPRNDRKLLNAVVTEPQTSPLYTPRAKNIALLLLAMTQFVVVIDASIVNVALPSIGQALHFARTDLSWVVNAYALAFGGFLLIESRQRQPLMPFSIFRLRTLRGADIVGAQLPHPRMIA